MSGRGQGSGVRGGDWWYVQAAGREDRRIPRLLRPYECMHACPDRSRPQRELCLFCPAATSLTSLSTCTHCWLLLYLCTPGTHFPPNEHLSVRCLAVTLETEARVFFCQAAIEFYSRPCTYRRQEYLLLHGRRQQGETINRTSAPSGRNAAVTRMYHPSRPVPSLAFR